MKKLTMGVAVLSAWGAVLAAEDLTQYADPYIGCSYNGHCFAAAAYPLGLVQAGPDTGNTWWDYCSGYRYADTVINGFSQTHISGTGCGDLGDVLVMPFTGDVDLSRTNFASAYRKETQTATPGYYAVTLDDNRAKVQIAAAKHAAIYRIDYLDAATPRLFVDMQYGILNWGDKTGLNRVLVCDVRREGDRTIVGTVTTRMWVTRTYHFALAFDRPIASWDAYPQRKPTEKGPRFALGFDRLNGAPLMMKFGISASSVDAAKANLAAEIPAWDFAKVRDDARAAWNGIFGKLVAEGSLEQKKTFYTSLYHLFIQPNDLADVGGKPRYSTFSTWDTFRAAHPLYTMIAPEHVDDFVNSMLTDYDEHGFLPIWTLWGQDNQCMIGTHSIPVIVDAYLKGFRGFDARRAWAAMKDTLTRKHKGRGFEPWEMLEQYGYIPFDKVGSESVSRTLEFAYDDWCAARFAEALGEKADAAYFDRRAHNWTNVFDRTVCLARGKDSQGKWREPFNPFKLNVGGRGTGAKDFTEGNSWQYSWHVMQHPEELVALHGGKEKFGKHLDVLFNLPEKEEGMGFALDATGLIGQYAHGNEPSHHTTYLFQYAGRGDRTAELVREVCDKFYMPEPEGLCGNDDCGQMSAWYLFSAMGFYPLNPCGGDYVIGAPQLPKIVMALPGGKTLAIVAKNLSKANKYVRSVSFKPLGSPTPRTLGPSTFILKHADLMQGGELVFEMRGPNDNAKAPPAAEKLSTGAELFWYPAPKADNTGACVVVCPGGGYYETCIGYEGWALAEWFNSIGVSAAVLDYHTVRGTRRHAAPLGDLPLQEVQEAIRRVRERAAAFGVDPKKVGVMGFSAGGHLAATVMTRHDAASRPDFGILCYAVTDPIAHRTTTDACTRNLVGPDATAAQMEKYSPMQLVTKETPPVFILSTDSDKIVPSEQSVGFYLACRKAGVPAELHVWRQGEHGGGLCRDRPGEDRWPELCATWMRNMGF